MGKEELTILVSALILAFLSIIIVALFVIFQKRKNKLLLREKESEKRFEQEIAKTEIEIREETFRNISWELHDNIGQLITLAKIQLNSSSDIEEVKDTLDKGLKELRSLSKLINPDFLKNISLVKAISLELERLNRLNYINASIETEGNQKPVDDNVEIILFRILQEFISNTIKHARASHLKIKIDYQSDKLVIMARDNGMGFLQDKAKTPSGIGLSNIKSRANLIGAKAIITSKPNAYTQLKITYKFPS